MFKYSLHTAVFATAMLFGQVALAQDAAPMSQQSVAMASSAPRDPALKPVFEQFGGKPGLVTLMNDFMDNMMADSRTHPYFANSDRVRIKAELVDQFCVILDGPCTYSGKEDDWYDAFVAWAPTKHVSLTLAYADLGNIVIKDRQRGLYASVQVGF